MIALCRRAWAGVALFSACLNVLMLSVPLYMMQVYDRVLATGNVDTLLALTVMVAAALLVLGILDALRARVMVRVGAWLDRELGTPVLAGTVADALRSGGGVAAQGLRDLSTVRGFFGGTGVMPLFDAPWTPVFLAIIFLIHPLLGWIALGGAIAQGIVSVNTKRKTVQHLEGGIVADILVEEGEAVSAGQALLTMHDTQARTLFTLTESQYHSMVALRTRIVAERDALPNIPWPEWQREATSGEDILLAQQRIFGAGAHLFDNHAAIYEQQIAQMREEIVGLEEEIKTKFLQLDLLEEAVQGLSKLVEQGYEGKTRLLALKRRMAEIAGAQARNRARIARVEQAMGETRLKISELRNSRMTRVAKELHETEAQISDLGERLAAARHVLS